MKKLTITLLLLFPLFIGAQSFTPSTFTESAVKGIKDGATVKLGSGTYTLSSGLLKALSKGSKSNVTFTNQNGKVTLKSTASDQPKVKFKNWKKLTFKNITFQNIEIQMISCSNSMIEKCIFTGQKFSKPLGKKDREFSVRILQGSNNTVKDCFFNWTHKDPGIAIKGNDGKNFKFINNNMTGRMKSCITLITARNDKTEENMNADPVTNHLVSGGTVKTTLSFPELEEFEDHGLYLHNISDVVVTGVTFEGWTARKGGYGIKLKGVKRIEVKKNNFKSPGIIISEAKNWRNVNDHIWIHDNSFSGVGIHSSNIFDDNTINNSILIEKNDFKNGIIEMNDENPSNVNKKNALAGNRPGGVYNNCTKKSFKLKSGIKASGNNERGCHGGGSPDPVDTADDTNNNDDSNNNDDPINNDDSNNNNDSNDDNTVSGDAKKYEAEKFSKQKGTSIKNSNNSSGKKYVDFVNKKAFIEWKVNVPSAGTYELKWSQANKSTRKNKPLKIVVNRTAVNRSFTFPITGGLINWKLTQGQKVKLVSGKNTIRVKSTQNDKINIDYMLVAKVSGSKQENNVVEVHIYPNPISSDRQLTVGFVSNEDKDVMQVDVYNYLGQKVLDENMNIEKGFNQMTINSNDLSQGVYLVKIKSSQGEVTKRLMVK